MVEVANTKDKIISQVKRDFSLYGNEGVSIRKLASDSGVAQSVIYYYFSNKNEMLLEIFDLTRKELGEKRKKLPETTNVKEMLKQRVDFQFENAQDVIYILKYYTHFRSNFEKNAQGYVPVLAYKHIKEVLERGVAEEIFEPSDVDIQAKVITHAINGFILEYFPKIPSKKEREELVNEISQFIYRGIKKKGGE